MKSNTFGLLVVILALFLGACVQAPATESYVPTTPTELLASKPTEIIIPTPNKGLATITGSLISKATGFAPEKAIFLARNISGENKDIPAMLSFSYQTSPRGNMSPDGKFVFTDVPAGIYTVALWTPAESPFFIQAEDGQDYYWITVAPDSLIDAGRHEVP